MNPQLTRIVAQQRIRDLRHAAARTRIGRDRRTRRNARASESHRPPEREPLTPVREARQPREAPGLAPAIHPHTTDRKRRTV